MNARTQLAKRLRVTAWLPTAAWAAGAGVLAAFAATAAAAGVASQLTAEPGPDEGWSVFAALIMVASVYAGPLAAVVAVGRGFHWWQAVLLCHGAAVVSFVTILFLSQGWPGVAGGAVAASGWTAAGLAAGLCCAARTWATRPRARPAG